MKQCPSCKKKMRDTMRFCPFDGQSLILQDEFIGTLLEGRYRLEEKTGESEIEKDYKATDVRLGRSVAVKLFQLQSAFDQETLNRLYVKLSTTSSIYHPNVITVFDFGVTPDNRTAYLVFEFIKGITLKEKIKRGRLSYDEILFVIEQICSALEPLHAKGMTHGNLDPENIHLFGDDVRQLKVQFVDFDSLGTLREHSQGMKIGILAGATNYMSPEQIQTESLDARADVYSLGVMLYEMLAGKLPFEASTPMEAVRKHIYELPVPLRGVRPDISKRIEAVVMRALNKWPEQRQPSALELARDFEEAIRRAPEELFATAPEERSLKDKIADAAYRLTEKPEERSLKDRDTTESEKRPVYLDENVQFTVYRPNRVRPDEWYTMLAFAHLSELPPDAPAGPDPIAEVKKQAQQILGDAGREYRTVTGDSQLAVPREGELTLVPRMPGIEFNPPFSSFIWQEPVHRQEFRLRASQATNGKMIWGRLSVYLGSILLAEVGLSIKVDSSYAPVAKVLSHDVAQARAFRKIFASYSHKDRNIVEQFERIAVASGDEFIRDWTYLRAGEIWGDRLMQMIKDATIFQLFWSNNSMQSRFVRQEWEYALSLNRPNFIRPVYWEDPFPEERQRGLPPESLRRLQFHRLISGVGAHTPRATQATPPDEVDTARIGPTGSPVLPARPKAQENLCGNCGRSKPATTRFCPYCGAKSEAKIGNVKGAEAPAAPAQPASPNKPLTERPVPVAEPETYWRERSGTTDDSRSVPEDTEPLDKPNQYSPPYTPPPLAQYPPRPTVEEAQGNRCRICGSFNKVGLNYCSVCGTSIPSAPLTTGRPPSPRTTVGSPPAPPVPYVPPQAQYGASQSAGPPDIRNSSGAYKPTSDLFQESTGARPGIFNPFVVTIGVVIFFIVVFLLLKFVF
jgi:serine/threonine protein kinase